MKTYDVIVVGASVSGCRTAELIAKQSYKVLVLEEHKEIGRPVKCTGLVSWRLKELLPELPKNIIVNTVGKAKFFSPNGNHFTLKSKKSVYVIDRGKLDRYLSERAKNINVEIKTLTRFENFRYVDDGIEVKTNKGKTKTKILIGADGANSLVAKQSNLKQPDETLIGIQTTVDGNFEQDTVELWFGSKTAPNFFAWVVPENENRARVGLATNKNPKEYLDRFLKERIGKTNKPDVGGLIRIGLMNETVADRVLLVGDAAYQIKPFSAGGIVYGLIASQCCTDACIFALQKNKFNKEFLKNQYDKKWKRILEKPIKKGLLYRKILYKFSDEQLNLFFSAGKKLKLTKILESFDMDLL